MEDTQKQVIPINPRTGNHRGMHPNTLKALKENRRVMKPGETRNRNGFSLTARAKKMLPDVCPYDAKSRTWAEVLAEDLLRQAHIKPDGMSQLLNRFEGKVSETVDITSKGESIKQTYVTIPDTRVTEALAILGQCGIKISTN